MSELFDPALSSRIRSVGVIAVLIIDNAEDGPPLAASLLAGGVTAMELTLRTPAAFDALRAIRKEIPDMLAGLGTVLSVDQVQRAVDDGAAFAVAPGFNPRVAGKARELGLSFAPGIATPSDIEGAVELGAKLLKFFPAEPSGGVNYLKAIAAPYAHLGLEYIPLGGLNGENLRGYVKEPLVAALGGSWIAPRERIRAGDWNFITAAARDAVASIREVRALLPDSGA